MKQNDTPFQVEKMIGQGGMGRVYKVFDKVLQREVALKVMAGDATKKSRVQRFYREAEATAKLKHPNIIQLYNFGEYQGKPYFTMELIHGEHLKKYVTDNRLNFKQIAEILIQVAAAIDYAHSRGVIHRDLKPENIMMDNGVPKVMDFGLAKLNTATRRISRTGEGLGTLSYMPPEQMLGQKVGPYTDIYAIGVILYELLTGKLPFSGSTNKMITEITSKTPVRPKLLTEKVPKDLEIICLKCLQKKPVKRYQSAQLLAEDLERFAKNEPLTTRENYLLPSVIAAVVGCIFLIFAIRTQASPSTISTTSKSQQKPEKKTNISPLLKPFYNKPDFPDIRNILQQFLDKEYIVVDINKINDTYYFLSTTPASEIAIRNIANNYDSQLALFHPQMDTKTKKLIYDLLHKNKVQKCLVYNPDTNKLNIIQTGGKTIRHHGPSVHPFLYEWKAKK
ncbi:serine/threonine protein kinase [Candidatus Uabimicrobium amorphum]|uniref:Protein kinase n=1 Tax=Uabimicrobium amorphum TaxID=2596890 RepID=A0A5S9IIP6_UABAM|nr:serine/threonine-protein kinase [Candidatus Uabimicrobium amorphum]BBM82559.1 protein kinase [Candidatus Uabimicrobium amorphum]